MTTAVDASLLAARLDVLGGAHRTFRAGEQVTIRIAATGVPSGQRVTARLTVDDIFDRPVTGVWPEVVDLDLDGDTAGADITVRPAVGYYRVTVEIGAPGATGTRAYTDLGVVPAPHAGVRPDSFFMSNTAGPLGGENLALLASLGIKVQRCHWQPLPVEVPAEPHGIPLTLDFGPLDAIWQESVESGTWVLPIVGYSFAGTNAGLADQVGMHGPPRDAEEFVTTWRPLLERYPDIRTYEFWNEPWIFGWAWADTPEAYRRLQQRWCEMALAVDPGYRIITGNSAMFTEDCIEPDPACWQDLLAGTTHHPYTFSLHAATLRAGDQGRSVDHGMLVNGRMGLPFYYLTEGGTWYHTPTESADPGSAVENNIVNARKMVQYFVRTALGGAFAGNAQWGIGYGPEWTRSNVSTAVMTHLLEDRPVVADVWPTHELVWGAIFANPQAVTPEVRTLPRAEELSARWSVPVPEDRASDATKVAVLWATTGPSADRVDTDGTMTIDDATGLAACNLVGQPIPPVDGRLVLPLGENPVYVMTETLDIVSFRERLATARLDGLTPLNLSPWSLLRPADEAQDLRVRVESQVNRTVRGRLAVAPLGGGGDLGASVELVVEPGQLVEVVVAWPGRAVTEHNQYGVVLTAETDAGDVRVEHVLSSATFSRRTPAVDAAAAPWEGSTPVVLDSDVVGGEVDLSHYVLNPHLDRPTKSDRGARVVARVHTAYDDDNVYVRAEVNEDSFRCSVGTPVVKASRTTGESIELPYRNGVPEGLNHPLLCGDALSLAFGFRDRVPGWGRQPGDPYEWKGHFYDTDYNYLVHLAADGPMLVRQWGPDTTRRGAYQVDAVPGCGPVAGARVAIERYEDRKLTVYEVAIPRSELTLFDPAAGACRFGFLVMSDEAMANGTRVLEWSAAAGVFDHWRSAGSFSPSYSFVLPCQTFFGIEA